MSSRKRAALSGNSSSPSTPTAVIPGEGAKRRRPGIHGPASPDAGTWVPALRCAPAGMTSSETASPSDTIRDAIRQSSQRFQSPEKILRKSYPTPPGPSDNAPARPEGGPGDVRGSGWTGVGRRGVRGVGTGRGSLECRRGSQLRLERGPAGKSPQTRTRLRGEANFETHCLRGHETGGPRKGVGEPSCTMEPATW